MATLTYTEITNRTLDYLIANTSTNAPVPTAELLRAVNDAYMQVWEEAGRGVSRVASSTAWAAGTVASGTTGLITNIHSVHTVFFSAGEASDTSGSIVIIRDLDYILWLKNSDLAGSYSVPKVCSITRIQTDTEADKGKHRIDYHPVPGSGSMFFPIEYTKQFTPMDGDGSDIPDLNDLESYDVALMGGLILAPRSNREHLMDELEMLLVSSAGKAVLRKRRALLASYDANDAAA